MKAGFKTILLEAKQNSTVVGAFNIFNELSAMAAVQAAEETHTSIILQTSVATVKQIGVKRLIQLLHNIQECCEIPVAIHLDHCRDPQLARDCVDAGWDSVMFDGSHLPFEENINLTQAICEYAHQHNADVEGELGTIAGVEDDIISEKREYTDYTNAVEFIKQTNIDAFAPSIGTAHGIYKQTPKLDFELTRKFCALEVPIVIHGGSGLSIQDFQRFVSIGASKINISTALKHSYLQTAEKAVKQAGGNPLTFDKVLFEAVKETVLNHIRIFEKREVE